MWPKFKTQDEVPEAFRDLYVEKDGEWVAKDPGDDAAELKGALQKERKRADDAEKKARDEADKAAGLARQLEAAKATGPETDKKVSEMLAKWEKDKDAAVAAALEPVQAQLADKDKKLRKLLLTDNIRASFIKAGGRPEKADAAVRLNESNFDLAEDRPVVKNDKGEITTTAPEDYFKTWQKEMPEFYVGTKATGGGAAGIQGGGGSGGGKLTAEEILKNPIEANRQAMAK